MESRRDARLIGLAAEDFSTSLTSTPVVLLLFTSLPSGKFPSSKAAGLIASLISVPVAVLSDNTSPGRYAALAGTL
jgi:hypothetical protein